MEILSREVLTHQPEGAFEVGLMVVIAGGLLLIGGYWLYEILSKETKFSIGAIVCIGLGLLFGSAIFYHIKEETYEVEQVKVLIKDWNVVYEEGWEVVDQDGKIVSLERRVEE